ncbi:hypothetical protein GQ53DRAFT_747949 [Thozetella sp. PMI_491]|nr:hypothetical protein GQ53DRAFT_747949 [Thozetella sp. PMI_491]
MSSNVSTPNFGPQQTSAPANLGAPAPTAPAATNDDDIPPLYIGVLDNHDEKVDALKLVADSVAQQRQVASLTLVFHPACLAALAVGLGTAYQFAWVKRNHDLGLTLSMLSGVIMTYLLAIRYVASPYIRLAEEMKWSWLVGEDGEEDTVIGTRFGDEVIGALVLRLEPNPGLAGKKKNRSLSLKGGRGVIRGWTTRLRYRGKGVGADMLQEAIRVTREKCGKDAAVGFAQEHANSTMVLPEFFNRPFRKQEQRAAKALDKALGDWEGAKRKR